MHLADLNSNAAKAELLGDVLKGYEKRQERIKNLLRAAGVPEDELSNGKLRMPGYGDIVNTAGTLTSVGGARAELFWSACSSLAHGDLTGTLAVLDRETMATDGDISWVRFTGSVMAALVITAKTIDMTEAAFTLYTTRARAPY
ncbi:hypothetical protein [Kitasatospora herbaricolor]|uniref:hypothetical protein n=1 Tax=Kitasatospora herbaricolor TaxID=68217 RepID=UPI0036D95B6D